MITLTPAAINKIKELNEEDELQSAFDGTKLASRALRIAVKPGGCSGFSYDMFFETETEISEYERVENFDGVKVVIDPESAKKLEGAILDYKEGLQGAGFSFNNPSATRSCGCGQSFS